MTMANPTTLTKWNEAKKAGAASDKWRAVPLKIGCGCSVGVGEETSLDSVRVNFAADVLKHQANRKGECQAEYLKWTTEEQMNFVENIMPAAKGIPRFTERLCYKHGKRLKEKAAKAQEEAAAELKQKAVELKMREEKQQIEKEQESLAKKKASSKMREQKAQERNEKSAEKLRESVEKERIKAKEASAKGHQKLVEQRQKHAENKKEEEERRAKHTAKVEAQELMTKKQEQALADSKKSKGALLEERNKAHVELRRVSQEFNRTRSALDTTTEELTALKSRHEKLAEVEAQLKASLNSTALAKEKLQQQYEATKQEHTASVETVKHYKNLHQNDTAQLKALEASLASAQKQHANETAELKKVQAAMTEELEKTKERHQALEKSKAQLFEKHQQLQKELAKLTEDMQALQGNHTALQQEKKGMYRRSMQELRRITMKNNQQVAQMKSQSQKWESQHRRAEIEKSKLLSRMRAQMEHFEKASSNATAMQQQAIARKDSEITTLDKKLNTTKEQLTTTEEELTNALKEPATLKAQIAVLQAEKVGASPRDKSSEVVNDVCSATTFTNGGEFDGPSQSYKLGDHSSIAGSPPLGSIRVASGCVAITYDRPNFEGRPAVFQFGSYRGSDISRMGFGASRLGSMRVIQHKGSVPVKVHAHRECKTKGRPLGNLDLKSCAALAVSTPECQATNSFMWSSKSWEHKACFCCSSQHGGPTNKEWDVYSAVGLPTSQQKQATKTDKMSDGFHAGYISGEIDGEKTSQERTFISGFDRGFQTNQEEHRIDTEQAFRAGYRQGWETGKTSMH
jgi:hypothetical protein